MERRPIRILIGKVGLDGHDRGAKVLARGLRDAGMEVIYSGLWQTPESLVRMALQEDVDVIGISILSGAHMTIFPRVHDELVRRHAEEILVIGGGIIPPEDAQALIQDKHAAAIFAPGESIETIAGWIREHVPGQRQALKDGA
ncbi:MAG: cobalamin B12-binding domain-containing protein [Firmicutes bacterium]|nr:cobalamin B12-binding domain-containing protein [Bacillota bacterium]